MPKMTFLILFCFLLIYVCAHNALITKDLKPIVRNGLFSSNRLQIFNSVIAPPKPGTKVAKPTKVEPPNPIFRENRDILQEMEDYFNNDSWVVILYNDPFNKRQYVEEVLMQVFGWEKMRANEVMMQAHNFGFAITGVYTKAVAEERSTALVQKGLIAEAVQDSKKD